MDSIPSGLNPDFELARCIDHTLLTPTAGLQEYRVQAREAARTRVAAFCVPPFMVAEVAPILKGTKTVTQTVIGFPLGFHTIGTKVFEAREAAAAGAGEIDMVVNRAYIRTGRMDRMAAEIQAVVQAVAPLPVKTILEISDLTMDEILASASAAVLAGAAMIKTSTGFFGEGAKLDVVRRLRDHLGPKVGIKASGGIRDLDQAWAFIQAGATRVGASRGLQIMAVFEGGAALW
jgi:deoxyribose-phosphate aldolase